MNPKNKLEMNSKRDTMTFKIDYNDLQRIIKALGYDKHTAIVVADYLDECIDYELNLSNYLWNILPYFVQVFKTKTEAEEYIKEELTDSADLTLYECKNYQGVYLEWR